jgi:hypothetical protein
MRIPVGAAPALDDDEEAEAAAAEEEERAAAVISSVLCYDTIKIQPLKLKLKKQIRPNTQTWA